MCYHMNEHRKMLIAGNLACVCMHHQVYNLMNITAKEEISFKITEIKILSILLSSLDNAQTKAKI